MHKSAFHSPIGGQRSPISGQNVDNYLINGYSPELVIDDAGVNNLSIPYYRYGGVFCSHSSLFGTARDRSDAATMFDSSGNLVWSPHNLFSHSEQFDNAAWATSNASITADATNSPEGTLTADRIQENANTTTHRTSQTETLVVGSTVTAKVWAKADERSIVQVYTNHTASLSGANFDLNAGTTLTVTGVTATMTDFGDGWYLCAIEFTVTNATASVFIAMQTSDAAMNAAYAGDNSSGLFLWGGHEFRSDLGGMASVPADERGLSSDATYLPTTTAARFLPRREAYRYNGSSWVIDGHIQEPAGTNLFTESNPADWSGVVTSLTVTDNNATGIDGQTSAVSLITTDTAAGSFHLIREAITKAASATDYTVQIAVKDSEYPSVGFGFASLLCHGTSTSNRAEVDIDLSDGTVQSRTAGTGFTVYDADSINLGNGWWIMWMAFQSNTDTDLGFQLYVAEGHNDRSLDGDGSSGIYVDFADIKTGQILTSIVPTAGSTVTRATDPTTDQVVAAKVPASTEAFWMAFKGRSNYADNASAFENVFAEQRVDASNLFDFYLDTNSTRTGQVRGLVEFGGVADVATSSTDYTPGVGVQISAAMRVVAESSGGANDGIVQVSVDGSTETANTTVGAISDLSSANLDMPQVFSGTNQLFIMGTGNPGAAGIAEASA